MSADKCPVCGRSKKPHTEYECGKQYEGMRTGFGPTPCRNAERLAIERAAEVERLTRELKDANELIRLMSMRKET